MNAFEKLWSEFRFSDFNIPTSIEIIDIIDILIVAFIIYTLVLWVKETRAWSLFKGILIIVMFSVVAIIFQLNTILWILSNTLSVGITAVIVVFQPELRKALEQLGKTHFNFSFFDAQKEGISESTKCIEDIIKSCEKMSQVKTGALILIEREVGLGEYTRTGIKIDAIVSTQLLMNIFEDKTPLHDGAVIIKNNRITAATCYLPLTESLDISKDLGTRHRAAVGVSEVSDAIAIVVSEETGKISVAIGGKLLRNISPEKLRALINQYSKVAKRKLLPWKGRKQND